MSSSSARLNRRAALKQIARYTAIASGATIVAPVTAFSQPPETPPDAVPVEPQNQPPLPDPAATIAQLEAELFAQSLEDDQAYAGWKHHIGKPEEAVVHVRVTTFEGGTSGAGQTTRVGSGVVVRCDGFVLLPEGLFGDDRALQKTSKVSLTFRAADGDVPAAPLAPVSPPQYHSPKTDYVLVKVNDHHFKGLHLLDVRNITDQMPVTVVWAAPPESRDAKKSNDGVVNGRPASRAQTQASHLPVVKTRAATVGGKLAGLVTHVILQWTEAAGEIPPLGAAVIEPTSGGVLGIVTESRAVQVAFSPFGYFQHVSNEVGLKVSIEDIIAPTPNIHAAVTSTGQVLSMVKVSGGPTRLKGELANTYRTFYRTDVVCMPDFYIDALPVTVGSYRDWLGRGGPRQPLGWVESVELLRRQRNPDLPVSGIISDDALRYAAGHKKRLPTPVEWARAGMGGRVKWIKELMDEWEGISGAQEGIRQMKVGAYAQEIEKLSKDRNGRPIQNFKPPIGIASPNPTLDALSAQQQRLYYSYWEKKGRWFPYQNSPVGFYKEDESKWGVREVVSSVPELCQPNYAARTYEPAYKPYPTRVDPYYSQSNWFYWLANCLPGDMDGNYADFTGFAAPALYAQPYVYYDQNEKMYVLDRMNVLPRTGAGFRCAL